ncbi:hypothetical protein ACFL0X_01950 [Nanoarchaeota archaeon]
MGRENKMAEKTQQRRTHDFTSEHPSNFEELFNEGEIKKGDLIKYLKGSERTPITCLVDRINHNRMLGSYELVCEYASFNAANEVSFGTNDRGFPYRGEKVFGKGHARYPLIISLLQKAGLIPEGGQR